MSGDLKSKFTNSENLYLAFRKLSQYLKQGNEWYNPVELSTYEANLETNIYELRNKLEKELYTPHIMEILPFPKRNSTNGEQRVRQYFRPHLEDQIVWIAIVNVIGKFAEEKMPEWSFGNRLFRPIWVEENNGVKQKKQGSFSTTSSNFYRKWNQSWPYYRRHIALTVKVMGRNSEFDKDQLTDPKDKEIYELETQENNLSYYLNKNFWPEQSQKNIYWAGLDFKDFFPSISGDAIVENFKSVLVREDGSPRDDIQLILSTIVRMLKNTYDASHLLENELEKIGLNKSGVTNKVPTGLLVSGFLANVAMLEIDRHIDKYIKKNKTIAVFKYVDDHIILSTSKESLLSFLNYYHNLLKRYPVGVHFQDGKILPKEHFNYDENMGFMVSNSSEKDDPTKLDIDYPAPLMTMTLEKMSHLNDEDYDLLDNNGLEKTQADLTHFLLADFPDAEMKRETRMAFAAMKLCQVGKKMKPDFSLLDKSLQLNISAANQRVELESLKQPQRKLAESKLKVEKNFKAKRLQHLNDIIQNNHSKEIEKIQHKHKQIYKLLLKATKENPDKLKLWKRCVEYNFYTGLDSISDLLNEISQTDLHDFGKLYLKGYCLCNMNNLLLTAFNKLNSPYTSYWERYTLSRFVNNVSDNKFNPQVNNSQLDTPFLKETFQNFYTIRDFTKIDEVTELEGRFKMRFSKNQIDRKLSHNETKENIFHIYLWFFLCNTEESQKQDLWVNHVNELDLNNKISWSILSFFPHLIPESIIKQFSGYRENNEIILEKYDFVHDLTGVAYDFFRNDKSLKDTTINQYSSLRKIFAQRSKGFIRLDSWVDTLKKTFPTSSWLDPRYSEWTHLEIVKQISLAIIEDQKVKTPFSFFDFNAPTAVSHIHPSNYLIPTAWLSPKILTWKDWKDAVESDKIKLQKPELFVYDHRYLPLLNFWRGSVSTFLFGSSEFCVIIGLSVLLTKLLSRSFQWPPSSNKIAFIDQLFSQTLSLMERQPISSESRELLASIFSKRDIDFFDGSRNFEMDGGISVKTLVEFSELIEQIQIKLQRGQLESYDQTPRQLTYIDIDMLNRSKSIF